MFTTQRVSLALAILVIGGVSLMGFQNCSKARFSPNSDSLVLRTESVPSGTVSPAGAGDDGSVVSTPTPSPSPNSSPSPNPDSTPVVTPSPSPSNSASDGDLVECQMLHPNRKIILGPEFEVSPSNASSTRVCMSRKACLELINDYAMTHECSLEPGAGVAPADPQLQCTEIFPGSKGTCHNAKKLSDQEVLDQLDHFQAQ